MGDLFLTDAAAVEELAARARAAGRVALDTEFLWERTYAPQLCLVQLAVDGVVALVDPLAGAPLEPIAALVADPDVEVVMHAPSADLLAFGLHFGTRPTRVLDTQVVAGFVGLTASASLERLVHDALRITLGHHESFSDWKRRPLSPSQRTYAGDDVRHLLALADELRARLDRRGRGDWAVAELARRYPDGADVVPDPLEGWRRVQRRGRLSARHLAVLREVAAWRERDARRRDLPASWVLKDPTLVEIARSAPATAEALAAVRGLPKNMPERDVRALLAAVEHGREADAIQGRPTPPPAVQRRADAASGLAGALLRVRCADADVAPELVATRSELDRFLESVILDDAADEPLCSGWRRDLVGEELVALVRGQVALALRPRSPYLAILPLPDAAPADA